MGRHRRGNPGRVAAGRGGLSGFLPRPLAQSDGAAGPTGQLLTALMLGDRCSILTMAKRWKPPYKKALDELGLHHKCASLRLLAVDA